ncbi:MAG: aspartate carbamoyltransferase [Candidatus Thermoplasmatota archaeon]|nr:aspartate carbamoyltransferase [Candidatus Thermoplasmatota archaeon]
MTYEFEKDHVVTIKDFSVEEVKSVFDIAEKMIPTAEGEEKISDLEGKLLATLFYEPSTRTRLSFEGAMKRMGGRCIGFAKPGTSSAKKGETLADTIRVAAGYADIIVLRHPHEGAAQLAANFSDVPVINAGDGAGHHPTQTLLDLFTINEEKGSVSDNHIGIAGDLKYGRTVHSLTNALSMFDTELTFISPPSLKMPDEILRELEKKGIPHKEVEGIEEVIEELDVLYMTRIQRERFPSDKDYEKVAESYHIEKEMLDRKDTKEDLDIMHPLPRVDEITADVDSTPFAKYFRQAANGIPIRMALLKLLIEG